MPDCVPAWIPGEQLTAFAAAALTGCRLVKISAAPQSDGTPTVNVPGAGDPCYGVAAQDAPINTAVMVYRSSTILPVESGAAFAAGAELQCDASGRVITLAAGVKVGIAHQAAGAAGEFPIVALFL